MLARALAGWGGLLVLAFLNGAFRELLLVPRMGSAAAHVVSTLLLAALILGAVHPLMPWLDLPDGRTALLVGGLWVLLTLAFEFLAGHFLFHRPWEALLADYDLSRGRIWILVPVVTFLAPTLCRRAP